MTEEKNNKKETIVKSFDYKWYQFIIVYGLINIYYFFNINASIDNIYIEASKIFTSQLMVDGSNFSLLANLFASPILIFIIVANIIIYILREFIVFLIFKIVYFKSTVNDEASIKLYKYIKRTLLCFISINIIGILFYNNVSRSILFALLYLPIPIYSFLFIYLKMRKRIKI